MLTLRDERPADARAIRAIHAAAFGRDGEADLVDALRGRGRLAVSILALDGGSAVGHAALSPVTLPGAADPSADQALGLGPVGVLPAHQRRGIGSALIRHALEMARRRGHGAVVVLGDPAHYASSGFGAAAAFGLVCPYPAPPECFMAVELRPGALRGRAGVVRYDAAFDSV